MRPHFDIDRTEYTGEDGVFTVLHVDNSQPCEVPLNQEDGNTDLRLEYFAVKRSISIDLEHHLGVYSEEVDERAFSIPYRQDMNGAQEAGSSRQRHDSSSNMSVGESTNFSSVPTSPMRALRSPTKSVLRLSFGDSVAKPPKRVRIKDGHDVIDTQHITSYAVEE